MKRILSRLPPEIAALVHPDWKRNEKSYWASRETLLRQYEGQWIGFADDAVIASGDRPVQVLHAAQRAGTPRSAPARRAARGPPSIRNVCRSRGRAAEDASQYLQLRQHLPG